MDFGNAIMFILRRFSFTSTMIFSENRQIVSASQTRSIKSSRYSLSVPNDLIIEIFSRLPAKSAARCRFLSKFWDNLICSQYFIDLFAAKSSARPQILFVLQKNSKLSFYSADQPSENSSDNIAFTHLNHGPKTRCNYQRIGVPINGLVCIREYSDDYVGEGMMMTMVIYNSSTGEFLTLPKMKTKTTQWSIKSFLGYDPTEKLFKVLSVDHDSRWLKERCDPYQVLTLEPKQLSWRSIVCKPHFPIQGSEICINGVLYYKATGISYGYLIVCFDVRSETFRFIKVMETFNKQLLPWTSILTNYDGNKLGLLIPEEPDTFVTGESRSFELWVLKDEWSKHVYVLPPIWKDIVGKKPHIMFVGMIGTNEIVFSALYFRYYLLGDVVPYIFSYNTEKNTIRKLNIQRTGPSTFEDVHIFLNHVENVKLLN